MESESTLLLEIVQDCKQNQRAKLKWSLPNGFLHYANEVYAWMREAESTG